MPILRCFNLLIDTELQEAYLVSFKKAISLFEIAFDLLTHQILQISLLSVHFHQILIIRIMTMVEFLTPTSCSQYKQCGHSALCPCELNTLLTDEVYLSFNIKFSSWILSIFLKLFSLDFAYILKLLQFQPSQRNVHFFTFVNSKHRRYRHVTDSMLANMQKRLAIEQENARHLSTPYLSKVRTLFLYF